MDTLLPKGVSWNTISYFNEGYNTHGDELWWFCSGSDWTLLAYALVCVDVSVAAGARVRYILQVINQTWYQAASQITPRVNEKETRTHTLSKKKKTPYTQNHCAEGLQKINQLHGNRWATYPTKKQNRQKSEFMRPTSWLMRVMMACWQCGHTVCTGLAWNISPWRTVTVVVAPGGAITVAVCPPAGPKRQGAGPNCPGIICG